MTIDLVAGERNRVAGRSGRRDRGSGEIKRAPTSWKSERECRMALAVRTVDTSGVVAESVEV